jgi:drug/metabolite transporter (DMT)-like permease
MLWLTAALSAYFILAVVFLVDKHLLTASIPNPKVYAFYVGVLGSLVLFLIPFTGLYFPGWSQFFLGLFSGAIFIYALFYFYRALQKFEASRVIPAIGGLTPLFSFALIYLLSWGRETLSLKGLIAFALLIVGTVLITASKDKITRLNEISSSAIVAFLLALAFVSVKYVYLVQTFWNGFIWRSLGGFLMAICFFVFFSAVRKEVTASFLGKKEKKKPFSLKSFFNKTAFIFILNQVGGAGATILQNWAIFLAPLAFVPVVQALTGVQYVFLFLLSLFLSIKFPKILEEKISKKIILQKSMAIVIISIGLAILSF